MEQLTYNAKIAVVKVLNEILNADSIVHENEVQYMNEVIRDFGLEGKYEDDVKSLMTLQALATIRELDVELKEMVAKMMGKMIVIDNDINYNEVKLYNAFCESCNIEKDFNVDEYEDVTLSGPFVNPEDLMNNL
jgi:uncharacterized tellurite resistance protein B-like protein